MEAKIIISFVINRCNKKLLNSIKVLTAVEMMKTVRLCVRVGGD